MNTSININFDQLSYSASANFFRGRRKDILQRVSGSFRGSELTAILGPSGSGKSTLLNVLSGFEKKNVSGSIRMNGLSIDKFHKDIVYIMQDNHLQALLTVGESMNFAMKFKIGDRLNSYKKWIKIAEILTSFGLVEVENECVKNLSGGQQKRLAIALEIVNDPTVIFLDEPTTGLDSVSSTICINLMKQLARDGKTIVCTIHQPSSSQLQIFDNLYVLASGKCVYQGSGQNLVPFLNEMSLECPESHSPADFLLETITGVYGHEHNCKLTEKIMNGRNENYRSNSSGEVFSIETDDCDSLVPAVSSTHSPSFLSQFNDLLLRNFIIMLRDKSFLHIRMLMHVAVGLLLGVLYFKIGNDAQFILNNFRLIFVVLSFLTYTAYYSIMVSFPLNFPWIKRECFNRWYSPTAFFITTIVSDFPILILGVFAHIVPVYFMTAQPHDMFRFSAFALIMLLNSICSQAFGLAVGSLAGLKQTLILAPVFMIFHGAFSGFYILKKDAHPIWHSFFDLSYLKYAAYGSEMSIMGFNRTKMECGAIYCHFRSPVKFLQSIDYATEIDDFFMCIWMLMINFVLNVIIAYFLMRRRLRTK